MRTSAELGVVIRDRRKHLALDQTDIAGLRGTGNRFIVDLQNGKPSRKRSTRRNAAPASPPAPH